MNRSAARTLLLAVAASVLLTGCGAMIAQNPTGDYSPVNAVVDGDERRLMLKGADVVAYFTEHRYRQGQAQFSSRYQDIAFRFASAEHMALFDRQPERYLPQFGGFCANGIAYAIPWGGDADTWKIIDGRLYIFGGQASKDAFELDEKQNLAYAQKYWKEEVADSNSFVQRVKRLIARVPHYKSGEELAQAVAEAKSKAGIRQ